MKYRLNTTNYHDFATFAVNKLPARSYFIPYPGRAAADAVAPKQKRYASPKVQCLNGEWDFKPERRQLLYRSGFYPPDPAGTGGSQYRQTPLCPKKALNSRESLAVKSVY